jgi:hypothetical protein
MITAGLTNSFKEQLLLGQHDLETDVLKIALYTADAVLGPDTTAYTAVNEVSGTGYTATGEILTGVTVELSVTAGIAYVSFNNPTWNAATFATRGALIYNSSKSNKSIAVLNFGIDQTMLSQQFQIQLPTNNADNALIRVT